MTKTLFFNVHALERANIKTAPSGFRYGYIPDIINESLYRQLIAEFPDVSEFSLVDKMSGGGRKRFYVGPGYSLDQDGDCACRIARLPKVWRNFMHECAAPETITMISRHVGVQFNSLSNFGLSYSNGGCMQEAHIDGVVRTSSQSIKSFWAGILYFNALPSSIGGTCLYGPDRKTVLLQATHLRNGLFFFEQHPQAWHGFPKMPPGAERRIVSLAYSQESQPISLKESFLHRVTCSYRLKDTLQKLFRST